jgi:hypothetical protein
MSLPEPLSAAGGQALQAINNSPSERRSSRRTSTARSPRSSMIVLGQYGEEALAEQMEGEREWCACGLEEHRQRRGPS